MLFIFEVVLAASLGGDSELGEREVEKHHMSAAGAEEVSAKTKVTAPGGVDGGCGGGSGDSNSDDSSNVALTSRKLTMNEILTEVMKDNTGSTRPLAFAGPKSQEVTASFLRKITSEMQVDQLLSLGKGGGALGSGGPNPLLNQLVVAGKGPHTLADIKSLLDPNNAHQAADNTSISSSSMRSMVGGRAPLPGKKGRRGPMSRSSPYRGVTFYRRTSRWEAHVWTKGKQQYLGGYKEEEAAARAYDKAVLKIRGMTADTNFPSCEYVREMAEMRADELTVEEFIMEVRNEAKKANKLRRERKERDPYRESLRLKSCRRWLEKTFGSGSQLSSLEPYVATSIVSPQRTQPQLSQSLQNLIAMAGLSQTQLVPSLGERSLANAQLFSPSSSHANIISPAKQQAAAATSTHPTPVDSSQLLANYNALEQLASTLRSQQQIDAAIKNLQSPQQGIQSQLSSLRAAAAAQTSSLSSTIEKSLLHQILGGASKIASGTQQASVETTPSIAAKVKDANSSLLSQMYMRSDSNRSCTTNLHDSTEASTGLNLSAINNALLGNNLLSQVLSRAASFQSPETHNADTGKQ